MGNELKRTIKDCFHSVNVNKRYLRPNEAAKILNLDVEDVMLVALAVGARYQLPRTTLIHMERMDDFMKHLYKIPGTRSCE